MAVLPDDFLTKLVAEVAEIKGIKDASGNVKENDPIVSACAKIAYVQICRYCNRTFHYGERTEYYDDYVGPTLLRSTPVDTQKPVLVVVDGDDVAASDVVIKKKSRLVLYEDDTTDTGDPRYDDIEITYTGGIATMEENNTLYTAAQMQTVANYHRKDTLGLLETSGEKGTAKTPADSGDVIESVKAVLNSLVYNGTGYTLDGE